MTPSKYQSMIYDWVRTGTGSALIRARAGCLGIDTKILMYDGSIKRVQDIEVNDKLMGPDSKPRRVLSLCRGRDQMYRVIPKKGQSWICNEEHILTLHNERIVSHNKKYHTQRDALVDISVRDFLKKAKPHSTYLNTYGGYRLQRSGVEFKYKKPKIDPYILGLWLGDGQTAGTTIYTIDQPIIDYLMKSGVDNIIPKIRKSKTCYDISLTGGGGKNIFREEFFSCIIDGQKTISKNYLINSREVRLKVLAGLLDSDGYLGTGYYQIITKFDILHQDVLFLARSLGLAAYSVRRKRHYKDFVGTYWEIGISGELSDIPCLLDRKKASPRKQIKSVLRTGFTLYRLSENDYYGFTLDGDGRFLLDDFTITHNSGKTTTIIEALKFVRPHLATLSLAFNKAIATTLQQKVPNYVDAMTVHSLGAKALYKYFGGQIKITKWKNLILFDALIRRDKISLPKKNRTAYKRLICDVVALYRLNNCYDYNELEDVVAYHGIDLLNGEMKHITALIEYIDEYNDMPTEVHEGKKKLIDFNDMIYLPVRNRNIILRKYDWIFVDEAQDLSVLHQHFIRKLIKPNTRCVFVGDDFQSIYGFAGADADSFANLARWPNMTLLPLSVCYRCGKNIVLHAKEVYDDIEFHPEQKEGVVRRGSYREAKEGDFILCRNNRPLVGLYFDMLGLKKKCFIKGKDIGDGILKLVDKVIDKTVEGAYAWFREQLDKVRNKLIEDGIEIPQKHPKYYNLKEKVDIIMLVCEHYDTMQEAHDEIERMFKDEGSGIMLSSIHKAKGLESDRVFVLMRELIPSQYATQPWQKRQETNLLYVTITRAKRELVYITDWSDKL